MFNISLLLSCNLMLLYLKILHLLLFTIRKIKKKRNFQQITFNHLSFIINHFSRLYETIQKMYCKIILFFCCWWWWWWWRWWWWFVFVVWLTNERRLAIFSAGPLSEILTIDQNLNLRRTRVQVLLNERI